jgi:hypothetical protein
VEVERRTYFSLEVNSCKLPLPLKDSIIYFSCKGDTKEQPKTGPRIYFSGGSDHFFPNKNNFKQQKKFGNILQVFNKLPC